MRRPRRQFTLGQLLTMVAVLAVGLALFRMPHWPIILAIGAILLGFSIDRARGGLGILGAMLGGLLVFAGAGLGVLAWECLRWRSIPWSSPEPYFILLALALSGPGLGAAGGGLALLVLLLLGHRPGQGPPLIEPIGPIAWCDLGESGLSHQEAGGSPP